MAIRDAGEFPRGTNWRPLSADGARLVAGPYTSQTELAGPMVHRKLYRRPGLRLAPCPGSRLRPALQSVWSEAVRRQGMILHCAQRDGPPARQAGPFRLTSA